MAYIDKEGYERKREWAAKRMAENSQIDTLTEEQHEALEWLCSVRHDVHCNQDDFFCDESANSSEYWNYIDDGNGGTIREKLMEAGLPEMKWSFNPDMYTSESVCYELDYTEEEREEERERCLEMAEKFNLDIEKYLKTIDEQHGTNYCPSGASRKF